jgi:hypothetical protein
VPRLAAIVAFGTDSPRVCPVALPAGQALRGVAHPEGDQHDAEDVPEDHEGGDSQDKPTEHAYRGPHPHLRRLPATEPGAIRFQFGAVALDGTTQGDHGSGPTRGVLG